MDSFVVKKNCTEELLNNGRIGKKNLKLKSLSTDKKKRKAKNVNPQPTNADLTKCLVNKTPDVISFEDFLEEKVICKYKSQDVVKEVDVIESVACTDRKTIRKRKKIRSSNSPSKKKRRKSDNDVICITDLVDIKPATNGNKTSTTNDKIGKTTKKKARNVQIVQQNKTKHEVSVKDKVICCNASNAAKPLSSSTTTIDTSNLNTAQQGVVSWCDKHQATTPDEYTCNKKGLGNLTSWLTKWRERIEKEKRYILKQSKKLEQMNKKKNGKLKYSDDEDFQLSDDEDWEEDNTLCNSYLITGPAGCGKTSALYVCAQQAGFKILELNASNDRSSKQVMTKFQEATQSYLVSGNSQLNKGKSEARNQLSNFFIKKSKESTTSCITETHMDKDKNSLIFLDEVDAVLDTDKGFWSSVCSIINTSKRPIVLTADSTSAVEPSVLEKCLVVKLKKPKTKDICDTLQTIAKAESLSLNNDDLKAVVTTLNHDPRGCINSMQFWTSFSTNNFTSNAGQGSKSRKTKRKRQKSVKNNTEPINMFSKVLGISEKLAKTSCSSFQECLFKLSNLDEVSFSCVEDIMSHCYQHYLPCYISMNYHQLLRIYSPPSNCRLKIHVPHCSNPLPALYDDIDDDLVSLAYRGVKSSKVTAGSVSAVTDGKESKEKINPEKNEKDPQNLATDLSDLHSLCEYLDIVTLCDQLQQSDVLCSVLNNRKLKDGVSDETDQTDDVRYATLNRQHEMRAALQLRGLHKAMSQIHELQTSSTPAEFTYQQSPAYSTKRYSKVLCTLYEDGLSRSGIYTDYLPALRGISRVAEHEKRSKFSRRFCHYLDSQFSQTEILMLGSEFEEVPI
uniref:Uncharacterized LOC100176493 n=2 Tax=Ciona intestinalis TaxID=7719 RepID=F6YRY7_CIOIN